MIKAAPQLPAIPDRFENLSALTDLVKVLGMSIAGSGIAGSDKKHFGELVAYESIMTGKTPIEICLMITQRFNKMHGMLSVKTATVLADFHRAGGKSKVIERTPDRAEIELTWEGETTRFAFTYEEAREEPFFYEVRKGVKESDIVKQLQGDRSKLVVKPKYATPFSRRKMLWHRVVSDGINAVCPEISNGNYCPDEVDDIIEGMDGTTIETVVEESIDDAVSEVVKEESVADSKPVATATQQQEQTEADAATVEQVEIIEKLFDEVGMSEGKQAKALAKREVKTVGELTIAQAKGLIGNLEAALRSRQAIADEVTAKAEGKASSEPVDKPGGVDFHAATINTLFAKLGINDAKKIEILSKRNAKTVEGLSTEQATELIDSLRKTIAKRQATAAENDTETSQAIDGPCTEEQSSQIKQAVAASIKDGAEGLKKELITWLKDSGLEKLTDMSFNDARDLLAAVRNKTTGDFFAESIAKYEPNGEEVPFG